MKTEEERSHLKTAIDRADVTWEEIGFAEFPLVTTCLKRPPTDTLEFAERVGTDETGEPRYRTWKMVGSSEYGLTRLPDLDIIIGILKLLEQHNYEKRLIACTALDLCQIAGLKRGGETYARLKAGLQRFTHTGYSAKNVFRHPGTKEAVLAEDFDIVSDFRLLGDRQEHALDDGLPASYVAVSAAFLNRLKNGQRKPIDLGIWRELPLGLEKPIYHYLDKNFYGGKDRHEIGLSKFGKRIALMGTYKPSKLKRLYAKPLDNLRRLGFLSAFTFEKSRSVDDPEKIVFYPGPRARTVRKSEPRLPAYQEAPKPSSNERIARKSAIPESDTTGLISYFSLKQFGVEKTHASAGEQIAAQRLLVLTAKDSARARAVVDFAIQEAKKTKFTLTNIGGVLSNSYPERALAALDSRRETATTTPKPDTQYDLKQQYEIWYRQEVRQRYDSLEPTKRDRLLAEATKELSEGPHAATSLKLSAHHLHLMAESRVRRLLGKELPSFEEWLEQRKLPVAA